MASAGAGSERDTGEDLRAAIRARREELFGPKPGTVGRSTVEVESHLLREVADDQAAAHEGASTAEVKYEMELGAHRETIEELLSAKDALIARLEETIRDRDTTIGQLRGRVLELEGHETANDSHGRGLT